MSNDFVKSVNVSTKIIVLTLILFSIMIANSLYYLSFILTLFLILFLLTNKSVKCYKETLINVKFGLLFALIAYIIVMGNITNSIIFVCKILLIILFIKQFSLTVKFEELCDGINTLLSSIKIKNNKIAYHITLTIYFIKFYIYAKINIFKRYSSYQKIAYLFSLKYNIFPRALIATKKSKELEFGLRLKNYIPKIESKNLNSKIVLYFSIVIFMLVVLKEVIF